MRLIHQPRYETTNWLPMSQLFGVRNDLDRVVKDFFQDFTKGMEYFHGWVPAMDVLEEKNNLLVRLELPGLKKEDIDISVHEGVLSISGERKREAAKEPSELFRTERYFGRFNRSVTLPKPVHVEQISAAYKEGILTITLPKTEAAKPRQIEVCVG